MGDSASAMRARASGYQGKPGAKRQIRGETAGLTQCNPSVPPARWCRINGWSAGALAEIVSVICWASLGFKLRQMRHWCVPFAPTFGAAMAALSSAGNSRKNERTSSVFLPPRGSPRDCGVTQARNRSSKIRATLRCDPHSGAGANKYRNKGILSYLLMLTVDSRGIYSPPSSPRRPDQ